MRRLCNAGVVVLGLIYMRLSAGYVSAFVGFVLERCIFFVVFYFFWLFLVKLELDVLRVIQIGSNSIFLCCNYKVIELIVV